MVMQKIYLYMSLRIYFARFVDRENGSMDTLDEIKYYCKEANPAGALLLTGQWGVRKDIFCQKLRFERIRVHAYISTYKSVWDGVDRRSAKRSEKDMG